MAPWHCRTLHATSPKREVHVVRTSSYADCVAISAFAQKEAAHDWRVLEEGRMERERDLEALLGIDHANPVATHNSVGAFFEAIGYDTAAKRLCKARLKALGKASRNADGSFRWVDGARYRVTFAPKP